METSQIFVFSFSLQPYWFQEKKGFHKYNRKVTYTTTQEKPIIFPSLRNCIWMIWKYYGQITLSLRHGQISSYCQGSVADVVNASDIFLDTDNLPWQILRANPVQCIEGVGWMFFTCWTSIGYKIRDTCILTSLEYIWSQSISNLKSTSTFTVQASTILTVSEILNNKLESKSLFWCYCD